MKSPENLGRSLAAHTAIGTGLAGLPIAGTILDAHRQMSHYPNTELGPGLNRFSEEALTLYGTDRGIWAAIHRYGHHHDADVSHYGFLIVGDLVKYAEEHPEEQIELPEVFSNLDPVAKDITKDELLYLNKKAHEKLKLHNRDYNSPESYTLEERAHLLDPESKFYAYPEVLNARKKIGRFIGRKLLGKDYQPAVKMPIEQMLLQDPHSPALHDNGADGIDRDNFYLYREVANMYRDHPEFVPDEFREIFDNNRLKVKPIVGITALYGAGITLSTGAEFALALKYGKKVDPKEILTRGVIGGTYAASLALKIYLRGGAKVNSDGHNPKNSGDKNRQTTPNPDGTYWHMDKSSESMYQRIRERTLRLVYGDEHNQHEHHLFPWSYRYVNCDDPNLTAKEAAKYAPIGAAIGWLSKHTKLLSVYGRPEHPEDRPDMPSEATKKVYELRARNIARLVTEAEAA